MRRKPKKQSINNENNANNTQYDPEIIKQIKNEVIKDLEYRQKQQKKHGYMPKYHRDKKTELDYDWWTDREEYDKQREKKLLRKQLRGELMALEKIQRRIRSVNDPQVRRLLEELLYEAQNNGRDINELLQSLEASEKYESGSLWDYLPNTLKNIDRRSFGWGVSAALLGLMLLPSIGKSFRPMFRRAMEETMEMSERAQGVISQVKEEFEDIVAEAQFNKLKDSVSKDIDKNN